MESQLIQCDFPEKNATIVAFSQEGLEMFLFTAKKEGVDFNEKGKIMLLDKLLIPYLYSNSLTEDLMIAIPLINNIIFGFNPNAYLGAIAMSRRMTEQLVGGFGYIRAEHPERRQWFIPYDAACILKGHDWGQHKSQVEEWYSEVMPNPGSLGILETVLADSFIYGDLCEGLNIQ